MLHHIRDVTRPMDCFWHGMIAAAEAMLDAASHQGRHQTDALLLSWHGGASSGHVDFEVKPSGMSLKRPSCTGMACGETGRDHI